MDKKIEAILSNKRDLYAFQIETYGLFFMVSFYLFLHSIGYRSLIISFIVTLFSSCYLFYIIYDVLKNVAKYNKNIINITLPLICFFTIVCVFLQILVDKIWFGILNFLINFIVLEISIFKFKKEDVKKMFSDEKIKEIERNFEK